MTQKLKVPFAHIQAMVDTLTYQFARVGDTTTNGCWAALPNGFQVGYGSSACVIPSEYNEELGRKYAQERAKVDAANKLWELEGYLLAVTGKTSDEFGPVPVTYLDRLAAEQDELQDKITKLSKFLPTEPFTKLPNDDQLLLIKQLKAMEAYNAILVERLIK